jgi:hypothetical protein
MEQKLQSQEPENNQQPLQINELTRQRELLHQSKPDNPELQDEKIEENNAITIQQ